MLPDTTTESNLLSRAASVVRWATMVLVLAMFVGTHLPIQGSQAIGQHDKLIHFWAYMTLAFMVAASWDLSIGGLRTIHFLVICLACAIYGAFDELTQPWVGRSCDGLDWLFDAAGVAAGVALFRILRPVVYRLALMMAARVRAS